MSVSGGWTLKDGTTITLSTTLPLIHLQNKVSPPVNSAPALLEVWWCTGTIGTSNATAYQLAPGSTAGQTCAGAASTTATVPMPVACTAKNLYAVNGTAGALVTSGIVTLYQSGVGATALTCTLGTGTNCHDTTHTVSIAAGDNLAIAVTTGQASDTTQNIKAVFECLP